MGKKIFDEEKLGALDFDKVRDKTDTEHLNDYWGYLNRGWGPWREKKGKDTPAKKKKLELVKKYMEFVESAEFIGTREKPKLSWPDIASVNDAHPKYYTDTAKGQLRKDWD